MKIAVLSSHTPSLFWFRMDMMQDFLALGHTVVAIGNEPEDKWRKTFEEKNITYIQADISRTGTNPIKDLKTFFSLKKILGKIKPDKIFTYQAKTVIYGSLAANALGIKEIYSLIAGCGSIFISTKLMAKILRCILRLEYKVALKYNKKVFFQNPDDVLLFSSMGILSEEKAVIINGSGVSVEKFKKFPLPKNITFLNVSRLIKDKGIVEYLEAAKIVKQKYPDVRFMLVGPFDTNPSALQPFELEKYINEGIVEYYGEQPNVIPYLEKCNVFVLPSYREGTPKTVLEAMACGRPIITTDTTGCRETVINGLNGMLVPIKDIEALANAMINLIEHPEKIAPMGDISRKIAEDKFDVHKVNKAIMQTMGITQEKEPALV